MLDVKSACVQEEARQAVHGTEMSVNAALSVRGVSKHLVFQMRKMAANLVSPASVDPYPKERQSGELGDTPQLGTRGLFDAIVSGQRPLRNGVLGGRASNKRNVLLHRIRRTKALLQRPSCGARIRKHDHARRSTVKPVDGVDVTTDLIAKLLEENNPVRRFTGAMDEQAAGFVDGDDVVVFVEKLELSVQCPGL